MSTHHTSGLGRRPFLRTAACGAVSAMLPVRAIAARPESLQTADAGSVRLGVASYSLRNLSREDAIAAIRALESPWVNIKSFHLPHESSPE